MSITINPSQKIIQLDSFSTTSELIWKAMVDWSLIGDNLKYGINIRQIGGTPPIALYIYLDNGWKIRPKEANGITTISGNILTPDGSSPIAPTLGSWQTLVNMETPLQAVTVRAPNTDPISSTEIHAALDSYGNKDDYKNDPTVIADAVLDRPA